MPLRVLIVEDHPATQKLMTYLLENRGYEVEAVGNGKAALEITADDRFDLILCDICMPEMDGFEVARHLKADLHTRHTPLVAITALVQPDDREHILASGFDGCLHKTIAPRLFIQQIQQFLPSGSCQPPDITSPPLCENESGT